MDNITRRAALGAAARIAAVLVPGAVFTSRGAFAAQEAALRFEMYKDARGGFRWRLKSRNGLVIATSGEAYKARDACRKAIELVKWGAATAVVKDTSVG